MRHRPAQFKGSLSCNWLDIGRSPNAVGSKELSVFSHAIKSIGRRGYLLHRDGGRLYITDNHLRRRVGAHFDLRRPPGVQIREVGVNHEIGRGESMQHGVFRQHDNRHLARGNPERPPVAGTDNGHPHFVARLGNRLDGPNLVGAGSIAIEGYRCIANLVMNAQPDQRAQAQGDDLEQKIMENDFAQGNLKEVRVEELSMERKIRLVYPARRALSHAARAFLEIVIGPNGAAGE